MSRMIELTNIARVYGKGGLLDQFRTQDMPRVAISVDLLDTGVVVTGELIIKVADVELLYVAVELAAGSWESMRRVRKRAPAPLCTRALRKGGEAHGTACSHRPPLRAP